MLWVTGLPAEKRRCWPSGGAGLGGDDVEDGGFDRSRNPSSPRRVLLETSNGALEHLNL